MADLVAVRRRSRSHLKVPYSAVRPAPSPRPALPPGRFGDLSATSAEQIAELAASTWPGSAGVRKQRRAGARDLLLHLADFAGETWTQRWIASGLDAPGTPVAALGGTVRRSGPARGGDVGRAAQRERIANGLRSLIALRVVTPSLQALRSNRILNLAETFRVSEADPQLDRYFDAVAACGRPASTIVRARFDIACVLLTQAIGLQDLTAGGLLHYAIECARLGVSLGARGPGRFAGRTAWDILVQLQHFPATTPHSLQACLNTGQFTAAELVDRYELHADGMRQLLIDYLERRRPDSDYSTWFKLAHQVAGLFWSQIEQIAPAQADLRLPEHIYQQWRAGLTQTVLGQPRRDPEAVLQAIRGFYTDVQLWAVAEPERWARWVVPCPVPPVSHRAVAARKRRVTESTAARTRERQPVLPLLVDHVTSQKQSLRLLLEAAGKALPGTQFEHAGVTYRRTDTSHDQVVARAGHTTIRVLEQNITVVRNLTIEEDTAFWAWACIETMRHSGVRVEELLELTQLSIRQYQRPNGEVVALMVIAPSKNDRERIVPMSGQLLHVVASIMRRHCPAGGTVPVSRRYDPYERSWSSPLPFLFQRRLTSRGVMSYTAVRQLLIHTCRALAVEQPALQAVTFTPHDFRRLFATELVNNGLPIHIGAQLLGHLDLQTTRGYVAVFEEDLVRHYQAFMASRRAQRPADEYRSPRSDEWADFETHFNRRKVELGNCARPYGTPCQHEHACIRCPMLDVDPAMLSRLTDLEADLQQRRFRAVEENWLGELEGLDLTLTLLREKRQRTQDLSHQPAVDLGLPTRPGRRTNSLS